MFVILDFSHGGGRRGSWCFVLGHAFLFSLFGEWSIIVRGDKGWLGCCRVGVGKGRVCGPRIWSFLLERVLENKCYGKGLNWFLEEIFCGWLNGMERCR